MKAKVIPAPTQQAIDEQYEKWVYATHSNDKEAKAFEVGYRQGFDAFYRAAMEMSDE